ncbi:MAG: hypothetical protein N2689_07230, partial [Verrucomicrobiae bacterium]|nr:hypothetical protein [Verrucomicrobiae bacterium]
MATEGEKVAPDALRVERQVRATLCAVNQRESADGVRAAVTARLQAADLEQYGIRWKLAGEDEEQAAAGAFPVSYTH